MGIKQKFENELKESHYLDLLGSITENGLFTLITHIVDPYIQQN